MTKKKKEENQRTRDMIEWGIAIFGMMFLLTAIGIILARAVSQDSVPANVSVNVEAIESVDQKYRLDFRIYNSGSETAAAVNIKGELLKGGQSFEESSATITYAPANSTRRGAMFFSNDPNLFEIKLRATGFEKP